jgi:hypothetical protein
MKSLEGQSNYIIWASAMSISPKGIMCYEFVVDGLVPSEMDNLAEVATFKHLLFQAQSTFIQVDSSDIFEKMIKFGSSYEIWTRLSTEYY